jgi:hypothetical protein
LAGADPQQTIAFVALEQLRGVLQQLRERQRGRNADQNPKEQHAQNTGQSFHAVIPIFPGAPYTRGALPLRTINGLMCLHDFCASGNSFQLFQKITGIRRPRA